MRILSHAFSTLCLLALSASPARAFNPEEHKLAGDLGSQAAAAAITKLIGASSLLKGSQSATDGVRLVAKDSIPKDSKFKGGFVPREKALEARRPLIVWVGSADRKTG